jgi:hypothetical protein
MYNVIIFLILILTFDVNQRKNFHCISKFSISIIIFFCEVLQTPELTVYKHKNNLVLIGLIIQS